MKKQIAFLLLAAMLIALCACGAKEVPVVQTEKEEKAVAAPKAPETLEEEPEDLLPPEPAEHEELGTEPVEEPESEPEPEPEPEPELEPEPEVAAERILTVSYEQPFFRDWDGDGTDECFSWGADLETGDGALLVEFPNDGTKNVKADTPWLTEDSMIAFVDLDGDGTEEVFLTGSDGTYNFTTYAFRMEEGTLRSLPLGADPALPQVTEPTYLFGCLRDTLDENGHLQIEGNIDLLGTYHVTRPFDLKDGAVCAVEGVVTEFNMEGAMPCTLAQDLPCTFLGVPNEDAALTDADTMSAYAVVSMTGVRYEADGSAAAYFATGDGMCGAFRAVPNTEGSGWTIGGISIFEAFEVLPFAG